MPAFIAPFVGWKLASVATTLIVAWFVSPFPLVHVPWTEVTSSKCFGDSALPYEFPVGEPAAIDVGAKLRQLLSSQGRNKGVHWLLLLGSPGHGKTTLATSMLAQVRKSLFIEDSCWRVFPGKEAQQNQAIIETWIREIDGLLNVCTNGVTFLLDDLHHWPGLKEISDMIAKLKSSSVTVFVAATYHAGHVGGVKALLESIPKAHLLKYVQKPAGTSPCAQLQHQLKRSFTSHLVEIAQKFAETVPSLVTEMVRDATFWPVFGALEGTEHEVRLMQHRAVVAHIRLMFSCSSDKLIIISQKFLDVLPFWDGNVGPEIKDFVRNNVLDAVDKALQQHDRTHFAVVLTAENKNVVTKVLNVYSVLKHALAKSGVYLSKKFITAEDDAALVILSRFVAGSLKVLQCDAVDASLRKIADCISSTSMTHLTIEKSVVNVYAWMSFNNTYTFCPQFCLFDECPGPVINMINAQG